MRASPLLDRHYSLLFRFLRSDVFAENSLSDSRTRSTAVLDLEQRSSHIKFRCWTWIEREARVNEFIKKLKQRGSNIVIRDAQRFSGGSSQTSAAHDEDPTGTADTMAYIMRFRSTLLNPVTFVC